jgi:hypothetical protein
MAGPARAQLIDDIDPRMQGDQETVRIRFNAAVRYLQIVPSQAADLYTLRFEVLSEDGAAQRQIVDESRRVPSIDGMPEVRISLVADPTGQVRQLAIRLSRALPMQARQGPNARSIDLQLRRPAPSVGRDAAPSSAARLPAPGKFALRLQSVRPQDRDQILPVPRELQSLEVDAGETIEDGERRLAVTVGPFDTLEQAQSALNVALPRFPQARIIDLSAPKAAPSIATAAPAAKAADVAPKIDTVVERPGDGGAPDATQPVVERKAAALMAAATQAMAAKDAEAAVGQLNELLKLPPNAQSMAAQELIGNAWEMAGSPARARTEYGLYMRLYPTGDGAVRVAQRLAALGAPTPAPAGASGVLLAAPRAPATSYSGSIAQYYYGGRARSDSLVNIASGIDQATISRTTESAIVTSLDLSARYAGVDSETRAVVRGSGATSLLAGSHSSSSIGSMYVEYRRLGQGLAVRAGRQSPISGGLLGLFDGVSLAYPMGHGLKLDVMGGVPASPLVSVPGERLVGVVLEADTITPNVGGNFYLLDQATQGITNRRPVGAELRYSAERWSVNSLVDYDTVFRSLNAVSLHGSFQAGRQTTVTLLFDARRAPSLQLTNALISSGAASLQTLLQTQTLEQVRRDAVNTSAIARQMLLSVSRPLNPRWQLAMDLRYSEIGALPQVGDFLATPATGAQYSYSAQLTGTNLYSSRDINNFNLSVVSTPFFNGVQFAYNNLTGMRARHELTIEPSIRVYVQRDKQDDTRLLRVGPGMRLSYRASQAGSLLGELLYELSRTDGATNHDHTDSVFFYVGYRYELF